MKCSSRQTMPFTRASSLALGRSRGSLPSPGRIIRLFEDDHARIKSSGKSSTALLTIHTWLQRHPISNTTRIKDECDISLPTVLRTMATLEDLGIVKEVTGKARHKVFVYNQYLDILSRGTEPLAR